MKIVYVHHAMRNKDGIPSNDDDLTKLGYKDCKLTSKILSVLKLTNIKAIYSSSFFRCKKTAEIINKKFKLPIFYDERLNEKGSVLNETWIEL